jgi:hypothetical protein
MKKLDAHAQFFQEEKLDAHARFFARKIDIRQSGRFFQEEKLISARADDFFI